MVQSLLPIWEELDRAGMQEAVMSPDCGKPLPEHVLRTLSDGLGSGNELKELCSEAENFSYSTPFDNPAMISQSMGTSIDGKSVGDLGYSHQGVGSGKNLDSVVGNEKLGTLLSQVSPFVDREVDLGGKGRLYTDDLQLPDDFEPATLKVADQEALRLLKWLASSQDAEDINSDDELIRETILSPLLPAMTISEVLEKADMEYENASQQECQDILDSVGESPEFEGKSQRDSKHQLLDDFSCLMSSKQTMAQKDHSNTDQINTPHVGETSKPEANSKLGKSMQDLIHQSYGSSLTRKHKRKEPLWGPLPFSLDEKVTDHFQPISFSITGKGDREIKDNAENEAARSSDVGMGDAEKDTSVWKGESTIVGCSVRDLMRRKRFHRGESAECATSSDKWVSSEEKSGNLVSCTKLRSSGHNIESNSAFSNSRSTFNKVLTDFHETNMKKETSAAEMHHEAFDVNLNTFMPNKLPLVSYDSSVHACTDDDRPIVSHEVPDAFIASGETSEGKNINVTGSSSMLRGTGNFGDVIHFENLTASQMEHSEKYPNNQLKDGSDSQSFKRGPHRGISWCDGNDKPLKIGNLLHADADGSGSLCTCTVENKICEKYRTTSMRVAPGVSTQRHHGTEMRTGRALAHSDMAVDLLHGSDLCVSHSSGPASMTSMIDADTMQSVGLRFCKKSPVIRWSNEPSEDAPFSITIPGGGNRPVDGRDVNECLPFFKMDCVEPEEVQDIGCRITDLPNHQEGLMGVPIHYHHDGSSLYILTPSCSPPSSEAVHRWLLHDGIAISRKNVPDASADSSLTESHADSIGDLVDSQDVSCHAYDMTFMDSDQVNKQKQETIPGFQTFTTVLDKDRNVSEEGQHTVRSQDISQISGPDRKSKLTPLSQTGFRDPASLGGGQQLTLMSIEVQAESRADLRPDPRFDAVNLIALVIQEDDNLEPDAYILLRSDLDSVKRNLDGFANYQQLVSSEEKDLFGDFMKIVSTFDPDILIGWDIQGASLGFLAERAAHLGIGLLNYISRTPSEHNVATRNSDIQEKGIVGDVLPEPVLSASVEQKDSVIEDEWGRTHASGVHVGGRIVLNVWRLIRSEVKLNMYTIEAVAEAVLRRKVPSFNSKVLTKWFASGPGRARYRCIQYILERTKLNFQILNQLDMINRTSELARVFGVDFFSVLSRGSQYRVESMLLRLAHTQNYLAISPGSQQVASQPAMECIPLVMEPESGFYADPVVVLDFQSLYPSMMIAYNLCFSTCLGKVTPSKPNTLGVTSYVPDPSVLQDLKHEILLTPNGVMYVPSKVRKGVLPRLLDEILSTRITVKQAMKKLTPSKQVLHRIYNARQLALKLIANVTYGYTAAGFSGRMPCAELADSIVQCGRRTLENAISIVETHDQWNARVIYGDTDSMFVLLQGRSVSESFQIGHEIAAAVTAINPHPVTLKMEKVYHPCFLLTKKRYVGYSYEKPDQGKPIFDAKGIETVRRDTCGAVSKIMEQSLRLFFEHQEIDKVKSYLLRQWSRILSGRISLQDFVFAKEVRLGTYSARVSSLPPAAIVAVKAMRSDPRAEPRYAERIPYVVVHGEPGARLVDMVVDPSDLMAVDSPFRLHDLYYINKQIIPALQRVFGLIKVDLNQWFLDMPRPVRGSVVKNQGYAPNSHRTRIDYYYLSKHCIVCGELVQASAPVCGKCLKNEAGVVVAVAGRTSKLERDMQHLAAICRHCGGGDWLVECGVKCTSLACSVFYERRKVQKELQSLSGVATELGFYPRCMVEWF